MASDRESIIATGNKRPGIFAIGEVRSGSVKRVGVVIGEGAAVVAKIQAFLARNAGCGSVGAAAMPRRLRSATTALRSARRSRARSQAHDARTLSADEAIRVARYNEDR